MLHRLTSASRTFLPRYEEVIRLVQQGLSQRSISKQTGLSRQTIRQYVDAGMFPESAHQPHRQSRLDKFAEFISRRVGEGCTKVHLWHELREQSYRGSYSTVCNRIWRRHDKVGRRLKNKRASVEIQRVPSSRRVMWLMLGDKSKQKTEEQSFVAILQELSPEISTARTLTRRFNEMVRGHKVEELDEWMKEAINSGIPEMESFVTGLKMDIDAVRAALSYSWSNGQVEGQVNKLKMIKRTMYGRAKLDLLRQRILAA
jgi:transposase